MSRLRIAAAWPLMKLSDPPANLATLSRWAEEAARQGARLLLTPETFITGYATEAMYGNGHADRQRFLSLAEPIPGPATEKLTRLSQDLDLYICAGILEKDGRTHYNTQIMIAPRHGYIGKYRKIQIGSTERWFSSPGHEFPVFDIEGMRTAIMICRDKSYPEIARILTLEGAQLLLNPHCTPDSIQQPFKRWSLDLCKARAMENGCYLIANNPVFDCPMRPQTQAGCAFAIDPYGEVLFCTEGPGDEEGMALIDVDSVAVQARRAMEGKDFNLYSRSPQMYHMLVRSDQM